PVLIGLKFFKLGVVLKTGLTMIVSMWAYAMTWGWSYAAVFVLLIFVHEMGHVVALRKFGVKAGAPVFIPFVGAFVALKEMPKDVRVEAWTAIAGPLVGTGGAVVCCAAAIATQSSFWMAAAYSGFFLNLFNLIPVSPLDGGRVAAAISPKLWIIGFVGALLLFLRSWNPILFMILIPAGRNVYHLWKKKDAAQTGYYEVDRKTKFRIALLYFALLAFLTLAMALTHVTR
ncbi:MAG TPA: site-2 protease family protein, partial [Bacteroidota bacterium]